MRAADRLRPLERHPRPLLRKPHTAVITQADLLIAFIEPFLKGVTPKGMFDQ